MDYTNRRALEPNKEKWWRKNSKIAYCGDTPSTESVAIPFNQIGGVFVLFFIGIFGAKLQLLYYYYTHKKTKPKKNEMPLQSTDHAFKKTIPVPKKMETPLIKNGLYRRYVRRTLQDNYPVPSLYY